MSTTVPGHSTGSSTYLERVFHVQERGSSLRTEILAGATTFLTMAYIVFVNPDILSEAGMPVPACRRRSAAS
jgi:adenine/guanine/hypoxanthine permease